MKYLIIIEKPENIVWPKKLKLGIN